MLYVSKKILLQVAWRHFLFYLSRKIGSPLIIPDAIQINFTFRCNLRCKMCNMYETLQSFKLQNRPYELSSKVMQKLIKEAHDMGIQQVILLGGEPLLVPEIFKIISLVRSYNQSCTVVTNGTLLTREIIEKIFKANLDYLCISIDAATEETYSKIRGENVFSKIIDNIELLDRLKEENDREFPRIVCNCTIMNQNLEELMDVVSLCRRLKVFKILFQPVVGVNTDQRKVDFSSPTFIPEERFNVLDKAIDGLIRYKISSKDNFDFVTNRIKFLKLIKKYFRARVRPQKFPCYAGYNRIQVVQEGKIYFCVSQERYEATFGDVENRNLKDMWFSEKAKFYRKLIRKCSFPCLQLCACRLEFDELLGELEKKIIFRSKDG